MSHDLVPYESLNFPTGEGMRAAQVLLAHLRGDADDDYKCVVKAATYMLLGIAMRMVGEPDGDDIVINSDDETEEFKELCVQIIEADYARSGITAAGMDPLRGLDWAAIIKLLLPILLKILEEWLDKDDDTPPMP